MLEGAVEKIFAGRTIRLAAAFAVTMPAGARHTASFGQEGARIVIVKARHTASEPDVLRRLTKLRAREMSWLGWRLVRELRASDVAAPLAAEGLALELFAAACREGGTERLASPPPAWLATAEEFLRAHVGERVGLGDLALEVGVTRTHLARMFRAHLGLSVGEYARQLRLAAAAADVAGGQRPLAVIAAKAGFADQSHFTRQFRQAFGMTPRQYRQARNAPG